MKAYLIFLIGFTCFELNAQSIKLSNSRDFDVTYVQCVNEDGILIKKTEKIDVIRNPSHRLIGKIQYRLKFLGYDIDETGVIDEQTGKQIALFNKNNGVTCYFGLRRITVELLNIKYKEKKKVQKKLH
ncbi:MAG: hypothetical protein R2797_04760 [Gelidibacter sp.]